MKLTSAFVLAVSMTSTAWAGSLGNGHLHPRAGYAFCFANNPRIAYFSRVFHFDIGPGYGGGGLFVGGDQAFTHYLAQRGYSNVVAQCRSATTEAGAVAGKKAAEDEFRAEHHNVQVVETDWSGS